MSDQEKWNRIYQDAGVAEATPVGLLTEFAYLLPQSGRALDLASGMGGNAVLLARHGLQTEAWDISDLAVERMNQFAKQNGLSLQAKTVDLQSVEMPQAEFDVIVVSHYLDRKLFPGLVNALRPDGLIIYQTFIKEVTDEYDGPGNPDFKLDANELLNVFAGLHTVYYREEGRIGDTMLGRRNIAQLIGQKRL